MYSSFTEEARQILINAKIEMKELKHPYIGSEHLLLSILKTNNEVSIKLRNYNISYEKFKKELIDIVGIGKIESDCFLYTPLLKRVFENAIYDSKENNNGIVTISHLFSALLEEGEGVAIRILMGMNINLDDLYQDFMYKFIPKKSKNKKLLVDELGIDLNKMALENKLDEVVGRDEEIKRTIEILCRRKKNNPILIGEAGVGKTAIVEELARLISIGKVPNVLKNKRIVNLDMSVLVAGTKYRGEFEDRINKILKELEENDDIILFIDEIHTLVGAGGAEGAIDASNIFKPALARNKMRCIGATTTSEYKKYISEDKALDRRFQKVEVKVPDNVTLKKILLRLRETYSNYHKTLISDTIIDNIIELSNKYIKNRYQPDAAIDLLDEVCAHVSLKENKKLKNYNELNKLLSDILNEKKSALINKDYIRASNLKEKENKIMNKINRLDIELSNKKNNVVTYSDLIDVLSKKNNIPIYELSSKNKKAIFSFEKKLKSNIIGHDKNIDELLRIYKKIKLGLNDDNMCISILFNGPSGVGKTELAMLFANNMSSNVIRLDMSEYSESHQVSKLLGSPAGYVGYNDNKNIFENIKDNPFTVLILDELEKASKSIIDLFFQIFDTGKIKDSKGEDIYFNNVIVIMTSNVGYNTRRIGFKNTSTNNRELKDTFGIPFINRIDNIINFDYLDEKAIEKIIKNKLSFLRKKYIKKNINIKISNKVISEIKDLCEYDEFGARKVDKVIKKYIDSVIINEVLNGKSNIFIKDVKKEKAIV